MQRNTYEKVEGGNYMEKLLNKMNEPDPREINYLERGIKGLNAQSARKFSTGTMRDIPLVHSRLY